MQATLFARQDARSLAPLNSRPQPGGIGAAPSFGQPHRAAPETFARTLRDVQRETTSTTSVGPDMASDNEPVASEAAATNASHATNKTQMEVKSRVDRTSSRDDAAASPDEDAGKSTKSKKAGKPVAEEAADEEEAVVADESAHPEVKANACDTQDPTAAAAESALAASVAATVASGPSAPAAPAAATQTSEAVSAGSDATQATKPSERPATVAAAAAAIAVASTDSEEQGDVVASAPTSAVTPAGETQVEKAATADADLKSKPASKFDAALAKMTKVEGADAALPQAVATTSPNREQPSDGDAKDQPRDPSAGVVESSKADGATKVKAAQATFDQLLAKLAPDGDASTTSSVATADATKPTTQPPAPLPPEHRFARDNVDNVVTSVRTQLNSGPAGGGQMRIRLDPPELGALEVAVKMVDGRMSAAFTTSNDQATQLLSHSLDNLKSSLEATGISVDRIQVRQSGNDGNTQQQGSRDDAQQRNAGNGAYDPHSRQGDQQRREAVNKMWRKLAYGSDEVDLVA